MAGMHDDEPLLESRPGTYAVLLRPRHRGAVRIGRLGILRLDGGCLIYVGSAQGPGGVAARCRHHLLPAARPRWHLDHLRPHCRIIGLWVSCGTACLEHAWVRSLASLPHAVIPLAGFGASDCRECPAHLVHLPRPPSAASLRRCLGDGCLVQIAGKAG
jgi:Uri superfamily endonuclease